MSRTFVEIIDDYMKLNDELENKVFDDVICGDMVRVVRCKDCKWWQDNIGYYSVSYCPYDDDIGIPDANDFCSHGERIEK